MSTQEPEKIVWADEDSDASAGDWADAASEEEREAAHAPPASVWGKPVQTASVVKDEEEFPTLGSQSSHRPGRGGRGGGFGGRGGAGGYGDHHREERSGDRRRFGGERDYEEGDRDRGYGGRGGHDDRERYDRPMRRDEGDRDRGYGGPRDRGFGDRDRGGYGDRDRYERLPRRDDRGEGFERERPPRTPPPFPEEAPWTAFVNNLNWKVSAEEIEEFFFQNGCPLAGEGSVRLTRDRDDRPRGIAYVDFADAEALRKALSLDGQLFANRDVRINVAENKRRDDRPRKEDRFGGERFDLAGDDSNWRELAKKAHEERTAEREKERQIREPRDDRPDRRSRERRDDRDFGRPSARPPRAERPPDALPALSEEEKKAREEKKNKAHNPFGEAKPRDELAAQRKLQELEEKMRKQQAQEAKKEEEEKKKKEDESKKKIEEEGKKAPAPKSEDKWKKDGQAPSKSKFDWKDKGTWNSEKAGAKRSEGGRGRGSDRREGGRGEASKRGDSFGHRGGRGDSPKRGEGRGERPARKDASVPGAKPGPAPAKAQAKAQPPKEEKPKETPVANAFDLLGEAEA